MVFQAGPLGVGEVGSVDLSHARERTKPSQLSTLQNRLLDLSGWFVRMAASSTCWIGTVLMELPYLAALGDSGATVLKGLLPAPTTTEISQQTRPRAGGGLGPPL